MKTHTMKMQAAISPNGRMQAEGGREGGSMPGSTNDLELLTLSGGVERMHESEAAGMAKGYVGMAKRYTTHTLYVPKKKPPLGELTSEEASYNSTLFSIRVAIEHLFGRMSYFGAVSQVFCFAIVGTATAG